MRLRRMVQRAVLGVAALIFVLSAQDVKPTCNHCSATYIATSELQAYVKRAMANGLVDQQVRSVDIGKSQIGIGVVYRGKLDAPSPEFGGRARPDQRGVSRDRRVGNARDWSRHRWHEAPAIDAADRARVQRSGQQWELDYNGVTYQLKPGDVIVVPAGVGHLFTKIDDHITYLMVRIDPDKAVPLKDEAKSKAYLQSDPKASGREK